MPGGAGGDVVDGIAGGGGVTDGGVVSASVLVGGVGGTVWAEGGCGVGGSGRKMRAVLVTVGEGEGEVVVVAAVTTVGPGVAGNLASRVIAGSSFGSKVCVADNLASL